MTTKTHITIDDIEGAIASEFYFTAADGIEGAKIAHGDYQAVRHNDQRADIAAGQLTFCVLILKNGTKIVGINYGAIDPARHSVEIGRTEARKHAIEQVWSLLGYELRTKLAAQPTSYQDRVRAEYDDLNTKLLKLVSFFGTDAYKALPHGEQNLLTSQYRAMCDYRESLSGRILAFVQ